MNSNLHLDPELLSAYLDQEVSAAERAVVQAHLEGCEACRLELESLGWTVALLQRLPLVEPPRTFYVTEAMLAPERAPSFLERLLQQWRPLLGSAAALAALLLLVVLVQPQTPQDVQTTAESAQRAGEPELAVRVTDLPSEEVEEAAAVMEAPPAGEAGAEAGATESSPFAQDEALSAPATGDSRSAVVTATVAATTVALDGAEAAAEEETVEEQTGVTEETVLPAGPEPTTVAVEPAPPVVTGLAEGGEEMAGAAIAPTAEAAEQPAPVAADEAAPAPVSQRSAMERLALAALVVLLLLLATALLARRT
jgi:hypothetical protein